MDESSVEEGRLNSILKPRNRFPLQEVAGFFPEDDTVTNTFTRNRRVSFGRKCIKEFQIGSAVTTQALNEYEHSSSFSEQSECSGPLDLALNKTCREPEPDKDTTDDLITPPECFSDSKQRAPEDRARIFTENCISIAKSVFQDKETELTAIIIGAKPSLNDEDRKNTSSMSFSTLEMSSHDFLPVRHPDLVFSEPPQAIDKSRFDFLDQPPGKTGIRTRLITRTPLASIPTQWDGENDENIPPAHRSYRKASTPLHREFVTEPTMEFTCANLNSNRQPVMRNDSIYYGSDMEETCGRRYHNTERSVDMSCTRGVWEEEDDDVEDPLKLDAPLDDFLADLSGSNDNTITPSDTEDSAYGVIHKQLADLSVANKSFRDRIENELSNKSFSPSTPDVLSPCVDPLMFTPTCADVKLDDMEITTARQLPTIVASVGDMSAVLTPCSGALFSPTCVNLRSDMEMTEAGGRLNLLADASLLASPLALSPGVVTPLQFSPTCANIQLPAVEDDMEITSGAVLKGVGDCSRLSDIAPTPMRKSKTSPAKEIDFNVESSQENSGLSKNSNEKASDHQVSRELQLDCVQNMQNPEPSDNGEENKNKSSGHEKNNELTQFSKENEPAMEMTMNESKPSEPQMEITLNTSKPSEPEMEMIMNTSKSTEPEMEMSMTSKPSEPEIEMTMNTSKPSEPEMDMTVNTSNPSEPEMEITLNTSKPSEPEMEMTMNRSKSTEPEMEMSMTSKPSEPEMEMTMNQSKRPEPEMEMSMNQSKPSEPEMEMTMNTSKPSEPEMEITLNTSKPSEPEMEMSMNTSKPEMEMSMNQSKPEMEMTINQSKPSEPKMEMTMNQSKHAEPEMEMSMNQSKPSEPEMERTLNQSKPSEPDIEITTKQSKRAEPEMEMSMNQSKPSEPAREMTMNQSNFSEPEMEVTMNASKPSEPEMEMTMNRSKPSEPEMEMTMNTSKPSLTEMEMTMNTSKSKEPKMEMTMNQSKHAEPEMEMTMNQSKPSEPEKEITINESRGSIRLESPLSRSKVITPKSGKNDSFGKRLHADSPLLGDGLLKKGRASSSPRVTQNLSSIINTSLSNAADVSKAFDNTDVVKDTIINQTSTLTEGIQVIPESSEENSQMNSSGVAKDCEETLQKPTNDSCSPIIEPHELVNSSVHNVIDVSMKQTDDEKLSETPSKPENSNKNVVIEAITENSANNTFTEKVSEANDCDLGEKTVDKIVEAIEAERGETPKASGTPSDSNAILDMSTILQSANNKKVLEEESIVINGITRLEITDEDSTQYGEKTYTVEPAEVNSKTYLLEKSLQNKRQTYVIAEKRSHSDSPCPLEKMKKTRVSNSPLRRSARLETSLNQSKGQEKVQKNDVNKKETPKKQNQNKDNKKSQNPDTENVNRIPESQIPDTERVNKTPKSQNPNTGINKTPKSQKMDSFGKRVHSDSPLVGDLLKKGRPSASPRIPCRLSSTINHDASYAGPSRFSANLDASVTLHDISVDMEPSMTEDSPQPCVSSTNHDEVERLPPTMLSFNVADSRVAEIAQECEISSTQAACGIVGNSPDGVSSMLPGRVQNSEDEECLAEKLDKSLSLTPNRLSKTDVLKARENCEETNQIVDEALADLNKSQARENCEEEMNQIVDEADKILAEPNVSQMIQSERENIVNSSLRLPTSDGHAVAPPPLENHSTPGRRSSVRARNHSINDSCSSVQVRPHQMSLFQLPEATLHLNQGPVECASEIQTETFAKTINKDYSMTEPDVALPSSDDEDFEFGPAEVSSSTRKIEGIFKRRDTLEESTNASIVDEILRCRQSLDFYNTSNIAHYMQDDSVVINQNKGETNQNPMEQNDSLVINQNNEENNEDAMEDVELEEFNHLLTRVQNSLEEQSANSIWKIIKLDTNMIIIDFPILEAGLLLNIAFNKQCKIINLKLEERKASKYQNKWVLSINAFGYEFLKNLIEKQKQKLAALEDLPLFINLFGNFCTRLNGTMRDALVVVKGCGGAGVKGNTLTFNLHYFTPLTFSLLHLDLNEMVMFGQPGLSFTHEMGCIDEQLLQNMLQETKPFSLQAFVKSAVEYTVKYEEETGFVTKRPPLSF